MIFDEIESHLYPRWQRSILRSLLEVASVLHADAQVQLIAATHSPLIMASAEPLFDDKTDAWFDLDLNKKTNVVELRKRPFVRHGDASRWLTSDVFDLEEARSIPAEQAIREAKEFAKRAQRSLEDAKAIDAKLRAVGLSDIDPFWVRWSYMMDELTGGK
jgi:AAA15 family ATPase/GTPase